MKKYKVLADTEIKGKMRNAGNVVDLEETAAAPLVEQGKLELVA